MPQEIEDAISQAAQDPKSAFADGTGATAHSLRDQIEVDRYLESKAAVKKSGMGIKRTAMVPPGPA